LGFSTRREDDLFGLGRYEAAFGSGSSLGRTSNRPSTLGNLIVDALDFNSQVQSLRVLVEQVSQWFSFRF